MTLHLDDARWRSAVDAHLRNEASAEQNTRLGEYTPQSDEHRAEAAFLAALAEPPTDVEENPAWLETALDIHTRTAAETGSHEHEIVAKHRWPWLAVAAVLIAGVGAPVLIGADEPRRAESFEVATLASPQADDEAVRLDTGAPWTISSGSARLSALPRDQALTVESELCAEQTGHLICADAGSRVAARGPGALALHEGTATIRSNDANDVRVELGDITVHAEKHSVVVIERQTAGWSVSVERGRATVTELGSSRQLREGESLKRGVRDSTPTHTPKAKPVTKASTLLGRARAQRRSGDTRAAMTTYADLVRIHPRSPAAQTARMSLAQLHLDRGTTKDALRLFRAYGKHGGALAEEAAYGEIRSLRKLGRTSEAKRAADAFVRRYPESPYGAKLNP